MQGKLIHLASYAARRFVIGGPTGTNDRSSPDWRLEPERETLGIPFHEGGGCRIHLSSHILLPGVVGGLQKSGRLPPDSLRTTGR
jgi:hypothetical protein